MLNNSVLSKATSLNSGVSDVALQKKFIKHELQSMPTV
jgi:hypothetical protein